MAIGVFAAAMSLTAPPPQDPRPWRIVDLPGLHVGVRPHLLVSPDELGFALSVQVTARSLP